MSLLILQAVLGSALLHALWNALIKTGTLRLGATVILSLGEVPIGLVVAMFCKAPTWQVMPWVIASGYTHFFYKLFVTFAYARGDLSRVYPPARRGPFDCRPDFGWFSGRTPDHAPICRDHAAGLWHLDDGGRGDVW